MATDNDRRVFKVRRWCNCCERHQIDKPENLETFIQTETLSNDSEPECSCNCRHEARNMCRDLYGSIYSWQIDKELWKNITKEEINRRKKILLTKEIDNNDENISNIKERIFEIEYEVDDGLDWMIAEKEHGNLVSELFNYIDKKFNLE